MLDIISKATENFIIHQIRKEFTVDTVEKKQTSYKCQIDLQNSNGDITHHVYLYYNEPMLKELSEVFLGEIEDDETALTELAQEATNMIVGSAKTLASEDFDVDFSIGIPTFISKKAQKMKKGILFAIDNKTISIEIEEV